MFKSKAYITLIVLLVLAVVKVNAYAFVNTLNIETSSATTNFPQTDISKNENAVKIVYSVFKGVKTSEAEAALYYKINAVMKSRPDSQSASTYFKMIDRIEAGGFKELNNGISSKPIITIDGITLLFKTSPSGTFKVSAWSPNSGSQPLLCQLVRRSLDVYRKQNNDLFLMNRTYDY